MANNTKNIMIVGVGGQGTLLASRILGNTVMNEGYDVKVRFTTDDLLNPLVEMDEQTFGPTSEAFGTLYGDGVIRMLQPTSYTSYYSSCEQFIYQFMTLYVLNKDGSMFGTVGTFVNVLKWISDDEAEKLMREGY